MCLFEGSSVMKKIVVAILAFSIVGGSCPVFSQSFTDFNIIVNAADSEKIVDGVITYCTYNDHAEVIKCSDKADGDIEIAEEINGLPVTAISENAFLNCSGINSVTLPEQIKIIEESAFEGCTSLTNINNETNINFIGPAAFKGCSSLKSFSNPIPLSSGDQIQGCTALTSLELADTGEQILLTNLSLDLCNDLERVIIPENYVLNDSFILRNCPALKEIILPAYSQLERIVITKCKSLETIIIPDNFSSEKSMLSISECASIVELDLSASAISNAKIEKMPALERIIINEENKINYSVADCKKLNGLTRSLSYSSEIDFSTCTALKDVYYYEKTSEKCHIPDAMLLAKNTINVHIRKSNSELQKYLEDNAIIYSFIEDEPIAGDANCDAQINMADAVLIMQCISNPDKYKFTEQGEKNADVDGSGDVTNNDALTIQRFKLKLIDSLT